MRKLIWLLILMVIIVIAGCGGSTSHKSNSDAAEVDKEKKSQVSFIGVWSKESQVSGDMILTVKSDGTGEFNKQPFRWEASEDGFAFTVQNTTREGFSGKKVSTSHRLSGRITDENHLLVDGFDPDSWSGFDPNEQTIFTRVGD